MFLRWLFTLTSFYYGCGILRVKNRCWPMHKKVWIGAIAITLIYWSGYQFLEENELGKTILLRNKHYFNFLLLIAVGLVGTWSFKRYQPKWLYLLWVGAYSVVIAGLVLLGVIDLTSGISTPTRILFSSIRLFFMSPVPFGILLFLKKQIEKNNVRS